MNSFPKRLKVENINEFSKYKERKDTRELRKRLYLHILYTQSTGYNLTPFIMERKVTRESLVRMVEIVSKELKEQGWGVEFLDTRNILYIFDKNNKPSELDMLVNMV